VTICVTASWVGATHCIKYLYLRQPITSTGYSKNNNTIHHHIVSCDSLHKNMKQKLKKTTFVMNLNCHYIGVFSTIAYVTCIEVGTKIG